MTLGDVPGRWSWEPHRTLPARPGDAASDTDPAGRPRLVGAAYDLAVTAGPTVADDERERRFAWFGATCERLHEQYVDLDEGTPATYIPQLAAVDPDLFAIGAVTLDDRHVAVGDAGARFTIQSISKLVTYGLALEVHGRAAVLERVGVAPTGERFNAVDAAIDDTAGGARAPNPMVNAGAIAIADLVPGATLDARLDRVLATFERYLGRRPEIDRAVWESERASGDRNRAIGYLLLSEGVVTDRVEETLDLYFAQCSVLVDVDDLAVLGATLANRGVQPRTGESALPRHLTRDVLTVALTCGMYDYAGEWAYSVGIPAKSGVGGAIVGVLPDVGGLAAFSPRLDDHGNSVRGLRVFEALSAEFDMHVFDPDRPWARPSS